MAERANYQGTVLVTDAGRGSAISIIRALGRSKWRVIAADSDVKSLGFRSRYAAETLLYPAPEHARDECIAALLRAAHERHVDLIIPVTDAIIIPLSEARAGFEGVAKLAIPDPDALAVVTDKMKTLALAEQLGVPAPRTCLVATVEEALEKGPALGWPLVLKPHASRLYRDDAMEAFTVCYAEDAEQLAAQMARFEGRCFVLLQEYYTGAGHGVELLLHEGRPLAMFQHKRLREIPINGGASALRESVELDNDMVCYATQLMAALRWTGLAMVEFKVGPEGPKLMEINGRVWGSLPLAVLSGMDFPSRLADLYLHEGGTCDGTCDGAPDTNYKVGVRSRNLELDMLWIATVLYGKRDYPFFPMPGRGQAVKALFELFNPGYKYDVQSLSDPEPGLAQIPRIIRKLARKVQSV
jgi:predicted ATP-grasp superfamily ATP-dependent carboligase